MAEGKEMIDREIAEYRYKIKTTEEYIAKFKSELKECEAEKARYLKENEYYREMLRRLLGV